MNTDFEQAPDAIEFPSDDVGLAQIVRSPHVAEEQSLADRPKFEPVPYPELAFPRCSFLEMKLWFSLVTLTMACMPWIQPKLFAGICGFAALVWLAIITVLGWDGRAMFVVWWAILAAYAIGCAVAMTYG